jgi:hypothetical protein
MADRTGRHVAVMLGGFALFAAMLVIATRTEFVILSFAALGLVSGISAGPIMSRPAGCRIGSPSGVCDRYTG